MLVGMASIDVGVGLWSMRSTATAPASLPVLYQELQDDARLAERLGLHSLWLSEHHFWYDGWCPSLLVAGASALAATSTLHVGTGVFLLPLHDTDRLVAAGLALERLAPGRFELGVGIGYREAEIDTLGISRRSRGARTEASLDAFAGAWAEGGPNVWIGGIAERSLRRAADRGLSLFLPSSMHLAQLREVIERARAAADEAGVALGRIGVLKNAWVTDGSDAARQRMQDAIAWNIREYAGSWWDLKGSLGFDVPELLDRQMARSVETALVGPPEAVASAIRDLAGIGVDLVVLHVSSDFTRPAYRENMHAIAADVMPLLR
jgi:alkanesulfonate monooxygenase SsuD/methylene tetrahydromethanopterin reductase-like flavin-dependent oxidoreductase (luciferase family)